MADYYEIIGNAIENLVETALPTWNIKRRVVKRRYEAETLPFVVIRGERDTEKDRGFTGSVLREYPFLITLVQAGNQQSNADTDVTRFRQAIRNTFQPLTTLSGVSTVWNIEIDMEPVIEDQAFDAANYVINNIRVIVSNTENLDGS